MASIGVITWNMRGATLEGDDSKKANLVKENEQFLETLWGVKEIVFLLQECGNIQAKLKEMGCDEFYHMEFSEPIGAGNNRCTTGLLIPKSFKLCKPLITESLPSGVRNYIAADVEIEGKRIRFASFHAVANNSAAEDGHKFLMECCEDREYVVCGGDFNCNPANMEADNQFTERLQEKGFSYKVESTLYPTHYSPSGEGHILDYICVKGLETGAKTLGLASLQYTEKHFSDHVPVLYEIIV